MSRKSLLMMISLSFLTLLGLSGFFVSLVLAENPNMVKPGEFVIEPPTLICLGFEWYVEGDENRDATVDVSYRKKGDQKWQKALPLLRIKNERSKRNEYDYTAPNMFAGSILDLEPDTEYECYFHLSDPDGVRGAAFKTVTVRTRPEPKPYEGGNVYHVYPYGWTGAKEQPAFTGLMNAYFMGSASGDWNKAWAPRVKPGDTIKIHAGLYKDDRFRYTNPRGLGITFDGTYYLTASGTPEKPIAMVAAGDGEVIFDGDGNHTLFNMMGGNYNYFEGITFRNTDIAILAGYKLIAGSSGLTVKRCRFENVGLGVWTEYSGSKNFYIADSVFIGKQDPEYLMGWYAGPSPGVSWQSLWDTLPDRPTPYPAPNYSYFAIKVYGAGHVVAHNYMTLFHDGMDFDTHGLPEGYPDPNAGPSMVPRDKMPVANDFYNNYVNTTEDNCFELDGPMHNMRAMRNLCFNHAGQAMSSQPSFAGPTYYVRNVVYNSGTGSTKWAQAQGSIYFHNTYTSRVGGLTSGGSGPGMNFHWRNNVILGVPMYAAMPGGRIVYELGSYDNLSTSDYNGFRPIDGAQYSFQWNSPPFDVEADYLSPQVVRRYVTLAEYSQDTGQDQNSILIDWDIFMNAAPPDNINQPMKIYQPADVDLRLKPNSVAVDRGVFLPNINEGYTGSAPDLGAYEVGLPLPIYGPRPLP